jgi:hypothetical protein
MLWRAVNYWCLSHCVIGRPGLIGCPTLPSSKSPKPKKPQRISLVSHSTLNNVLMCSVHTSDSKSTDWTTEGLWFTSRQQEESLPFEGSPARIKGYSGRGVKLNTHIFQLPMLRISGASCMLIVPTQEVLPLPFVPENGITSSLRNTLRFLARDDRQVTKKSGANTARYHRQNTLTLPSPLVTQCIYHQV